MKHVYEEEYFCYYKQMRLFFLEISLIVTLTYEWKKYAN